MSYWKYFFILFIVLSSYYLCFKSVVGTFHSRLKTMVLKSDTYSGKSAKKWSLRYYSLFIFTNWRQHVKYMPSYIDYKTFPYFEQRVFTWKDHIQFSASHPFDFEKLNNNQVFVYWPENVSSWITALLFIYLSNLDFHCFSLSRFDYQPTETYFKILAIIA